MKTPAELMAPDPDAFLPSSEKGFQNIVVAMAKRRGLLVYHTHDSRRSQPGFPDLVIVGPGGLIFRELKSPTGKATFDQMQWLQTLAATGADAGLWRPANLRDGLIEKTLARLCKPVQNGAAS